jgi:cell division protein FtsL
MIKFKFLKTLLILIIVMIFTKIYQHNKIIKLTYTKQRLERKYQELLQERSDLLIKHFTLKDYKKIKQFARENLKLDKMSLSNVITMTACSNLFNHRIQDLQRNDILWEGCNDKKRL